MCNVEFPRSSHSGHLRSSKHKANIRADRLDDDVTILRCAFKNRMVSYRVCAKNHHVLVDDFMSEIKNKVLELIRSGVSKFTAIKLNVELFGSYILETQDMRDVKSFNTKNVVVTVGTDVDQVYNDFTESLDGKVSEFQERESGKYLLPLL